MAAHVLAVWLNHWIFRRHVRAPTKLLVFATWLPVVWLPLLILLIRENSVWMMFIPMDDFDLGRPLAEAVEVRHE